MPAALARPFQGVLLKNVWSDLDVQKFKKVRQSIAQGYVEGKTTEQIIRELRGTRAKGYQDGIIQRDRRDVEAVVRTALGHTAGVAQNNVMEATPTCSRRCSGQPLSTCAHRRRAASATDCCTRLATTSLSATRFRGWLGQDGCTGAAAAVRSRC